MIVFGYLKDYFECELVTNVTISLEIFHDIARGKFIKWLEIGLHFNWSAYLI